MGSGMGFQPSIFSEVFAGPGMIEEWSKGVLRPMAAEKDFADGTGFLFFGADLGLLRTRTATLGPRSSSFGFRIGGYVG